MQYRRPTELGHGPVKAMGRQKKKKRRTHLPAFFKAPFRVRFSGLVLEKHFNGAFELVMQRNQKTR
jgi:hypothetical protein